MQRLAVTVIAAGVLAAGVSSSVFGRQATLVTDGSLTLQSQAVPKGTGIVLGRTVDPGTGQPVPGAVIFSRVGSISLETIVSDELGRFVLRDLPRGKLQIGASKAGYVGGKYGKNLPDTGLDVNTDWTPLELDEGARIADATIFLWKFAVIEGRVTDERDDPIVNMSVRALRVTYTGGQRRFSTTSAGSTGGGGTTALTDDRGVFRLAGLIPGEYVVVVPVVTSTWPKSLQRMLASPATPAPDGYNASSGGTGDWQNRGFGGRNAYDVNDDRFAFSFVERVPGVAGVGVDGRLLVYQTQYYPNSTGVARASVIALGSGAERTGVDFQMHPATTVKVSGIVNGPSGPAPNLAIRLVPDDVSDLTSDPELTSTVTDADGTFTFLGVVPGNYEGLFSSLPMRPQANGTFTFTGVTPGRYAIVASAGASGRTPTTSDPLLWATTEIVVSGQNESGITLSLQPGIVVSGTVTFEPTTLTPPPLNTVRGSLNPILTGSQVAVGQFVQTAGDDGSFRIPVMPGRYNVRAQLPTGTTGWLMKSAMYKGKDISDEGLEVKLGEEPPVVTVTFTDRPAEISGLLQDASGRPAPDYFIIVFPADKTMWRSRARRIFQVRPGTDGKFVVRNLLAGEYQIAALTDVAPGEQYDAAFLEKLVGQTIRVSVGEGEKKTQDIRIGK